VPTSSIIITGDDPMVEGCADESQRRKELAANELVERQPAASLQDIPSYVHAEVGVFGVMTDPESKPGVRDAAAMRVKGSPPHFVIAADGGFVRESCRVAEQVAQRDFLFRGGFETAFDRELGKVAGDRLVQVNQALLDRQHDRSGGIHL
jgi:hypothetical protein